MKRTFISLLTCLLLAVSIAGCATEWTSIFQTPGGTVADGTPAAETEISQLVKQLSAENEQTVLKAVQRLGEIDNGSTAVLNGFRDLLSDPARSADLKVEVMDAAYLFDRRAPLLPGLALCLKHPNEDVRIDACDLIGDIEKPLSIDILIDNLDNPYEDMREDCRDYLEFMTDREYATKAQWQAWWEGNRATFRF